MIDAKNISANIPTTINEDISINLLQIEFGVIDGMSPNVIVFNV